MPTKDNGPPVHNGNGAKRRDWLLGGLAIFTVFAMVGLVVVSSFYMAPLDPAVFIELRRDLWTLLMMILSGHFALKK